MSDFENMNQQPENGEMTQATRVVAAMEDDATVMPSRRRRSTRGQVEGEEATQQIPAETSVSEGTRVQPRVTAAPVQTPSQGVPRPEALKRADRERQTGGSEQEAKPMLRRPVSAPGYSQSQPMSASRPSAASVRRPRVEVLDEPAQPREEKSGKHHRGLWIAVIAVLAVAVLVLGVMLIPDNAGGVLGSIKGRASALLSGVTGGGSQTTEQPRPAAMNFTGTPTQVSAGEMIVFTLTTNKNTTAVRLVDEEGNNLNAISNMVDNADSLIWILNLRMTEAYSGMVTVQVAADDAWVTTDLQMAIQVTAPAATPEPAEPTAPAEEDAGETPVPVVIVDSATLPPAPATTAPAPTPTMSVTATPTVPSEAVAVTQAPVYVAPQTSEEPALTPGEDEGWTEGDVVDVIVDDVIVDDEPTPAPTAEPAPVATQEPAAASRLIIAADPSADPSLIAKRVIFDGSKKVTAYLRDTAGVINMPAAGAYAQHPNNILTFRGSAFRQNAAAGTVGAGELTGMSVKWQTPAGSLKGANTTYYGIGYTGQPAIVQWAKEVRGITNIVEAKRSKVLREVIIAGEDGKIYFLDLEDGEATRAAINMGYPMRGTPSVHPFGFPLMSVGQYARKLSNKTGDIGLRVYNLLNQKQVLMIDGLDKGYSGRVTNKVGSFETSALIDGVSDTMVTAGTNGLLYITKLGTKFEYIPAQNTGTLTINPSTVVMAATTKGETAAQSAIESSVAMYQNYVFYADMAGILRCVDTTTMEILWAVDTGDAVEAAVALDLDEDGGLWLYTANTLNVNASGGCQVRRINALTGEEVWQLPVGVVNKKNAKNVVIGFRASPVIGQQDLGDLVFFTVSKVSKSGASVYGLSGAKEGLLMAISKETGKVAWTFELPAYSYSSPVAVYNDAGKGWIVQGCSDGSLYLLDGQTGAQVSSLMLDGAINASPAVYKNTLVVGTQGSKKGAAIYAITLE